MQYYPIFAHLKHRPVLLIGAGMVAERKAQALLKAGALVHVAAPSLSETFQSWAAQGEIQHIAECYEPSQLAGKFLVIAATDDRALNQRIFQDCEAAGTFCNTVDDQPLCSFIVPAVVDRSPIQIAVSTGGAAPVLARRIREKLEAQLPAGLGAAAELAQRWRPQVKAAINDFSARRRFWETLFSSAFTHMAAQGQAEQAEQLLAHTLEQGTPPAAGMVTLVGAGPGDAGLLTLNALQALQSADIIFYDSLVSEGIRNLARRDAQMVFVGKRAGHHHARQPHINERLVQAAQQGKQVVRLKGGDPFVFGRGAEECEALFKAGIPFRIVPGISSALGATAYAGIPLTHRDYAQAVYFVTGNFKEDFSQPDWSTLSKPNQTVVIFMGRLKAEHISQQMTSHGRSPDTPAALIAKGTCSDQTVLSGTLAELGALSAQITSPALIVIGEVVGLRDHVGWFTPEPNRAGAGFTPTEYS